MGVLENTAGPWLWRGNQLYAPAVQQTLLRDVSFWNCTEADKAAIAAVPEMLAVLDACRIVLKSRDQDEREAKVFEAIRAVIGKATVNI